MNAIILCGGLSTRLGDITKSIPKVLLRIGDRTVLDWQLEKLASVGVTEVVMAAGHLSDVLVKEVGETRLGVRIRYAIEPTRLGTGGAIKFALQYVANPDEPTIILNGDILTSVPMNEMVSSVRPGTDGVILGSLVEDAATYGTLVTDEQGTLVAFREKEGKHEPGYINGGFYIYNPDMRKNIPDTDAFRVEYDVFPKVNTMVVHRSHHPWIDIGLPERLAWAREQYKDFLL
jgi:NDP-sugar pyrophosphorylase family protein